MGIAMSEMLPSILSQLGSDVPNWEDLVKTARQQDGTTNLPPADDEDSDDDIPDLVENFEEASEK